ncbi:aminotransferase class I/II-fold pyridoxal phosphate-dependent enzyme [Spelaeicoccus albus]|uniref:Aspartate/methionine/tyrosine aminotransferase/acetyl esterase/lipase n=1 Tax=Spelaeicoccus albus TaxID=1280376 RepID=A0A7Z0CZ01_9MICO|nr:aminotransferase class I/II-fold pyridoxal phosphate-dependent enzyme [Spelaeicoccus albus]NYI65846.1 aspartate/methionine/tyrosine aminotransferase/acetyl esterase/lipase [Spelaeicoccus albus]
MPLEPESAKFLDRVRSLPSRRPGPGVSVDEARDATAATADWGRPGPDVASIVNVEVGVPGGSIAVRVFSPARPRAVIGYLHGGGWVIGDIAGFDAFARALTNASDCAVALINYRKAPEFPFPTALSDAEAGLRQIADDVPGPAGVSALPLIIAGDSAGGNLAAVVARRERDRRLSARALPRLAGQILIYPVTDHDFDTASYRDAGNQLFLTRDAMIWYWDHYAPGDVRDDPDASPLRAADLRGIAPAAVVTAEYDVLRDEGEAYADKLADAGALLARTRMAGQTHGFANRYGLLPGSAELIGMIRQFVDGFLRRSSESARKPGNNEGTAAPRPNTGRSFSMKLAERLNRLGTETAFAVSAAAADWAGRGNTIYPFHLGDIDLPTPANIAAAMDRAVRDGKTGYCPGGGIPQLREALAADVGARRGLALGPGNITIHPGGKPVITKFIQAVMNSGDEVLYPNPGYPIYESQIDYFGGVAVPYRYVPDASGFRIDLDRLRASITPKTTVLIYNDLQNPISAESTQQEKEAVAALAIEHDLAVLSDEAYFDMRYSGESTSIASLPGMAGRTVILYTFSKKYAMTGWRLGAAIAPEDVSDVFAKLSTNNESCTTQFVQEAGVEALTGDQSGAGAILATLRGRRDAAYEALAGTRGISLAKPEATFYLFPDITDAVHAKGMNGMQEFADAALHATGVSFCTRLHFGRPQPGEDRLYARFAYSGLPAEKIREGLGRLRQWIEA